MTDEVTPVTELKGFTHSAEGEITSVTSTAGGSSCTSYAFGYTLRGEVASRPACPGYSSVGTLYANGVALPAATSFFGTGKTTYTWNDLMGVITASSSCTLSSSSPCSASWAYDSAGRMTSQIAPHGFGQNATETTATRTYDAENHLQVTTLGETTNSPYEQVEWGPDGHPFTIAVAPSGSAPVYQERLHWAGDQLLFTTSNGSGTTTLDDIKVDTQGDILPDDTHYNGLTFYDRGPGGGVLGCHNINGTTFNGVTDAFLGLGGNACNAVSGMPTSINWTGDPYHCPFTVGKSGTLGMPRPDGIADGCDVVQGVRSYDPTGGTWTTPDTYAGSLSDPMSLNSYLWNSNNPIDNLDPSGYMSMIAQPPEWGPPFWPPSSPGGCDPASCGSPLKTIAVVTARPHRRPCNVSIPGFTTGTDYTAIRFSVGEGLSGAVDIVFSRAGNVYVGGGASAGVSPLPFTLTITGGRLHTKSGAPATDQQISSFLPAMTYTGMYAFGAAAGATLNTNPFAVAGETGVGFPPSVSLSGTYGFLIGAIPGC